MGAGNAFGTALRAGQPGFPVFRTCRTGAVVIQEKTLCQGFTQAMKESRPVSLRS
jgi:hypothetical protein